MARELIQHLKEFIREPYAWPGGYQKLLTLADGAVLCNACAKDNFRLIAEATREPVPGDQWAAAGVDLFLEGEPVDCAHCYAAIHAAYCDCEECEPAVA